MSRVVPGKSEVMAESLPDKKLISVDFPAFVGPAITINGAQSSALPFFALINILLFIWTLGILNPLNFSTEKETIPVIVPKKNYTN